MLDHWLSTHFAVDFDPAFLARPRRKSQRFDDEISKARFEPQINADERGSMNADKTKPLLLSTSIDLRSSAFICGLPCSYPYLSSWRSRPADRAASRVVRHSPSVPTSADSGRCYPRMLWNTGKHKKLSVCIRGSNRFSYRPVKIAPIATAIKHDVSINEVRHLSAIYERGVSRRRLTYVIPSGMSSRSDHIPKAANSRTDFGRRG